MAKEEQGPQLSARTRAILELGHAISQCRSIAFTNEALRPETDHVEEHIIAALMALEEDQ